MYRGLCRPDSDAPAGADSTANLRLGSAGEPSGVQVGAAAVADKRFLTELDKDERKPPPPFALAAGFFSAGFFSNWSTARGRDSARVSRESLLLLAVLRVRRCIAIRE